MQIDRSMTAVMPKTNHQQRFFAKKISSRLAN